MFPLKHTMYISAQPKLKEYTRQTKHVFNLSVLGNLVHIHGPKRHVSFYFLKVFDVVWSHVVAI